MPTEDGDATEDRRLFGDQRETTVGYVASDMGVVRIELSADRIGNYSLLERGTANTLAADESAVLVGTDENVRFDADDSGGCVSLGFGPATAVGIDDGTVFAASPSGEIGRLDDAGAWSWRETSSGVDADAGVQGNAGIQGGSGVDTDQREESVPTWQSLGTIEQPAGIDGNLLAAESGVFRLGTAIESLGLTRVHDVTRDRADGTVLAATQDGLYRRDGDDWEKLSSGTVTRILATDDSYLTVTDDGSVQSFRDGSVSRLDGLEDAPVVDIAEGESLYAVTEAGDLFMAAESDTTTDGYEGWRSQPVGVRGVVGIAVLGQ